MSVRYLEQLSRNLFSEIEKQQLFVESFSNSSASSNAVLWVRDRPAVLPFEVASKTTWQPEFIDRVAKDSHPGQYDLHDKGCYYCLDLASVFMALPLLFVREEMKGARILDLCASPGGKTIFAFRALSPELLVANEAIRKRAGALIGNCQRCGVRPVYVTSADSKIFAEKTPEVFDLVIVDAPCSGQSLLLKGTEARDCFHPLAINRCANRQKRILANAARSVCPGGYLAYMTCTFSREENEAVIEWLMKRIGGFEAIEVLELGKYQSELADFPSYRLWPWGQEGAGGFTVLLKRQGGAKRTELNIDCIRPVWSSEKSAGDLPKN